jgi:hypothetical protein
LNLDCAKIEKLIHSIPLVSDCDVVRNGALRMSTPFSYPNGDQIDVFLESSQDLFRTTTISDYGHTSMYLRSAQVEVNPTSKKQEILALILSQLNVKWKDGDLYVDVGLSDPQELGDAIFRLSQACLRISDFACHHRLRTDNPFRDEIEQFFAVSDIRYIPNQKARGRYRNEVAVDFETFGRERNSYVCVLSSLTSQNAHTSANEIFGKWYEIAGHGTNHKLITIYSDKIEKLRTVDRQRLLDFSRLISYPSNSDLLKNELAA